MGPGSGPPWIEIITENLLGRGGKPRAVAHALRAEAPLVLHGVSLSIGGVDPLDPVYLGALSELARELEVAWVSDHLCFGTHGGHHGHDLWPLPYTEEAARHVALRVEAVQEKLGQPILLENVSSYIRYARSEMTEWEFIAAVCRQSGCGLLLDVNNIIVSAFNHGFDPGAYLDGVAGLPVRQLHLAGHLDHGTWKLDDHAHPVPDEVWDLYRQVLRRFGPVPTIVEWDQDLPPLEGVLGEARKAQAIERDELGPP